ncbi:MAG: hypothetical protein ACE5R6_09785 [Candidatus Heimdallarchaeota archaeon]
MTKNSAAQLRKQRAAKHMQQTESSKAEAVSIGIVSELIASLCCLGPAFTVLLGLSGFGAALSLTQFQPYFLALSIISSTSAVWIYLRRKNQGQATFMW